MDSHSLKTLGYLISTISVLLLGAVSWSSAAEHPPLLVGLVIGMAASIAGMFLRWLSYDREKKSGSS